YRIAQEALTNARKHAEASKVEVALLFEHTAAELTLEIRDWGRGFVPEEKLGETKRVGLQSMAERVNLLEGHFHLESELSAGTRITAKFAASPLEKESISGDMAHE
ncbi:sensor histidine kinase, partial [bacterium]